MMSSSSWKARSNKQCKVCGAKAASFNYNGLACESCKTFFRRNALKPTKFACENGESCVVNRQTRTICKCCRLAKCRAIGMRSELIWQRKYRCKNLTTNCALDLTSKQQARPFDSLECRLLEEMNRAAAVFPEEDTLPIIGSVKSLIQALSLPKNYARMVVAYCKSMASFRVLSPSDKLALVKSAYVPLITIRFAFMYEEAKNGFVAISDATGRTALFTHHGVLYDWNKRNMPIRFNKFFIVLSRALERDSILRNILQAQYLFRNLSEEAVSHPEFIRYQYCVACRLLRRYLENKYRENCRQASEKYWEIMDALSTMTYQLETVRAMFEELDLAKSDPVHAEIFDLL